MLTQRTVLALSLLVAAPACASVQDERKDADPMASFARLMPGEWWVTFGNGTSGFERQHWGPGKHSLRKAGAVDLIYWHPGRKQVCVFGLDPWASGVSEGTVQFAGETGDAVFDLYQTSGPRKMGLHWQFDGPDKLQLTLLEATGPEGLKPMNGWAFVRKNPPTPTRAPSHDGAPRPATRLKALEPLVGHTWEAQADWGSGESLQVSTVFEWVAEVDGIWARTRTQSAGAEPTDLLDAYFYHHTGTGELRCLALSHRGGVYEGGLSVLEGGGLQLDLKGYEGDQVVPLVVRFDLQQDGTLRDRVWSLEGSERKLLLDVRHTRVEPRKD